MKRIDTLSDDSCFLFRIGGDEFALVTDLQDINEAEKLAKKITSANGQPIIHNNIVIPIGMRAGCAKIVGNNIRYKDLYTDLYRAIENAKEDVFYYTAK